MSDPVIVKVQIPLEATGPGDPPALIYQAKQAGKRLQPCTKEIVAKVKGAERKVQNAKAFFYATIDNRGLYVLGDEAPWQTW